MLLSKQIFGSSQSRADLLTLGLAVTNILTGLVWLTIRPKSISVVRAKYLLSMVNFR
jgi:phage terminase large subunit-like protein